MQAEELAGDATGLAPAMVHVVGVRFRQAGKIYYFDPRGEDYAPGEGVVVETSEGLEAGEVAIPPKAVPADGVVLPLRPVVRRLGPEDEALIAQNKELEREALQLAAERARAYGLPMKLVAAEASFTGNRVRLFFVAEQRVDFRNLVRDLAGRLRARIELRQIGVRDQAKILGGIGDCGRELCCTTWLTDFEPVSIRMAKLQNLSLNPSRLSGQCGRLKCCLKYENDMYLDILKNLPKVGTVVGTREGKGTVVELLVLKESVLVELGDGRRVEVKASELLDPDEVPASPDQAAVWNGDDSASDWLPDFVEDFPEELEPVEALPAREADDAGQSVDDIAVSDETVAAGPEAWGAEVVPAGAEEVPAQEEPSQRPGPDRRGRRRRRGARARSSRAQGAEVAAGPAHEAEPARDGADFEPGAEDPGAQRAGGAGGSARRRRRRRRRKGPRKDGSQDG